MKFLRYFLVTVFWIFGTGSLLEGKFLYGIIGLIFMSVSIAYAEFNSRNNEKYYWFLNIINFLILFIILYFEGAGD